MKRVLIGVSVVVLFGGLSGCHSSEAAQPQKPQVPENEVWLTSQQLPQVHLGVIQKQPIPDTLLVGGRVAFDDLRITHIFSPVAGRVTKVFAQPGERVKKGASLVSLASPDVGSAFSDLVKAQADLVNSELDFKRQKALFEAHASAQKDLESAESNYRKAKAEYQRAQAKTKMLRVGSVDDVSQEYTLRAAIEGEVIARNVNPGIEVQGQYAGGNAQELFTIGELDQVLVYGDLHEQDLQQVKVGGTVVLEVVAYPGKRFEGTVDWISDTLDPTLRTARLRCRIQNPDRLLKPEMYATIGINVSQGPAVAVPKKAVVHLGDQTVIFVAAGQAPDGRAKFERRPVKVNEDVSGDLLPVSNDAVHEGDTVVVDGAVLLTQVG